MSLLTSIYKFIKPELADSPPDITAMNPNWDKIDAELNSHKEQINDLTPITDIYVATTGSDITGDGTSSKPYATITKALSLLNTRASHAMHRCKIYVASGIYNEDIIINSTNQMIVIVKNGDTNPVIKSIRISLSRIQLFNITISNLDTSTSLLKLLSNADVYLSDCVLNGNTNANGIDLYSSSIRMYNCVINNCSYAISASYASSVFTDKLSGSGNLAGLRSYESFINSCLNTMSANTQYIRSNGTIIENGAVVV